MFKDFSPFFAVLDEKKAKNKPEKVMKSSVYLKFILRADFISKNGTSAVFIHVTHDKKQTRIRLPLKVHPENWLEQRERVSEKEYDYRDINKTLNFYEAQAKTYISDCQIKKQPFILEDFKQVLFGNYNADDFYEFMKSETDNNKKLAKETSRTYYAKINKFKRFKEHVSISEINYDFLMKYQNYTLSLGNDENTIYKDFAIFKSFLNRAVKKGLFDRADFDKIYSRIRIKFIEGKREFLSLEELQQLRELQKNSHLQKIRKKYEDTLRQFLFSCYTGLRYQDFCNLHYGNIIIR
jgi:hypothetical protein